MELQTQLPRGKAAAQPHCSRKQSCVGILPGAEAPYRRIEDAAVGSLGHSPGSLRWTPHWMVGSAQADARGVAGDESYGQTTRLAFERTLYG